MPQNTVRAILQTRNGYLWLTTSDGLVRFDGARFVVFNKANSRGIKSNRFTALFESSDGSLWIGMEDRDAVRYHDGAFATFPTSDGKINPVWAFQDDPRLGLIARTPDGIMRWDGERFTLYVSEKESTTQSPDLIWAYNSFVFLDRSGLHIFEDGRYQTYREESSDSKIASITENYRGEVWFVNAAGELKRFEKGRITTFALEKSPTATLSAAYQDSKNNLWLGWSDGRLSVRQDGEWMTYELAHSRIVNLYEDREGTIWFGSETEGLFRARRQAINVLTAREGLIGEKVYPIVEDRDGGIWFGVWDDGLYRYKDKHLTRYTRRKGFPESVITALYQDRSGKLWVGEKALYRFENNRLVVHLDEASFDDSFIYVITEDRAGNFWIGTRKGLYKLRDGKLQRFTTTDGLPHQTVQAIHEDRNGNLWLGTLGGLSVLRDGKFQSFTENDGLTSNHVRAITEDTDGVLWIGTYDGGISRFENGKFTNYTTANGLFNNGAFQILEDDNGDFWISCNLGIYRVSRREMNELAGGQRKFVNTVSYGKGDGLVSLECNGAKQPAGIKARDGRLWFPTQKGVAVINPSEVSLNPHPPPVVIESISIDNETSVSLNPQSAISIAPGKNNLEITYTGLSFIKPENLRFRYKIEGLDPDWIEAGNRRTAYYSHLPPGTYSFKIIAANADGVWNLEGATLRVIVHPPFWRTWWFLSLASGAVVLTMFLVYSRRVSSLRKAHAAQEAFSRRLIESQEQDRKRIAAELHDSIGQSLVIIKNRAVLGLDKRDDRAFEQLDEIADAATQAINEVHEITYDLRPYQLDRLGLTKAINSMIRRAESTVGFETEIDLIDDAFPKGAEIGVYRIVQESVNNIIKHSNANKAKVKIKRNAATVEITIEDNGQGFDAENIRLNSDGFGLMGIAERARMLGGELAVSSKVGQGTIINIKLPSNRNGNT